MKREKKLLKEVAELLGSTGMTEFPQRLGLYLADSLAGDAEVVANLLQRPGSPILKPESQLENAGFTLA